MPSRQRIRRQRLAERLIITSPATQIGLTATPKETHEVSSTDYFGDPVYVYSLKERDEDGFLAPL